MDGAGAVISPGAEVVAAVWLVLMTEMTTPACAGPEHTTNRRKIACLLMLLSAVTNKKKPATFPGWPAEFANLRKSGLF
jgi:hypothetical protein